jgi:pyruvate,water dikinase
VTSKPAAAAALRWIKGAALGMPEDGRKWPPKATRSGEAMGKLWVCDDEPSTRFPVFTRGNIGEVFGRPVSPLTWTTLGVWALERGWREGYCQMGLFTADEFKPLGQAEVLACFGGYLYINMSVLRVLAMRIPGMTV